MKIVGIVIAGIVVLLALSWLVQGNDFFLYRFFAPKYEQVRRETFEQTKSYKQGTIQELEAMEFQFYQSDSTARGALASIIVRRAADFPADSLPQGLRYFIDSLRNAKTRNY